MVSSTEHLEKVSKAFVHFPVEFNDEKKIVTADPRVRGSFVKRDYHLWDGFCCPEDFVTTVIRCAFTLSVLQSNERHRLKQVSVRFSLLRQLNAYEASALPRERPGRLCATPAGCTSPAKNVFERFAP